MDLREIKTRNDLAQILNIKNSQLTYILYVKSTEEFYTSFVIPKKNGGMRRISAPKKQLKYVQRRLADVLWEHEKKIRQENNIKTQISHAFEKNKSTFTNAWKHKNKKIVINFDLENYFESIHFGRVKGYFQNNKNYELPEEVSLILAQLTCYNGSLPQGAPTSPILTNMICHMLDMKILYLARKYRLCYTRYADDMTFSTNDLKFKERYTEFCDELSRLILHEGFVINHTKTRIQYKGERQEVTGLVVNQKVGVLREFYKETRAMAHNLYVNGEYYINGVRGTLNQLQGRFAYINSIDKKNNELSGKMEGKDSFRKLNGREKQFQRFLFYRFFFANPYPLVVTEGKTDILYIKAAIKNLYKEYPKLASRRTDGTFEFHISFLNRTKRTKFFFNLQVDGADSMSNIYYFSAGCMRDRAYTNYMECFKNLSGHQANNTVILLFDNEWKSDKPLYKFAKDVVKLSDVNKDVLKTDERILLLDNLYLLITPMMDQNKLESDIEMLFKPEVLNVHISGKRFSKSDQYDKTLYYGKNELAKYVMRHYQEIDFTNFKPLLTNLTRILEEYEKRTAAFQPPAIVTKEFYY